VDDANDADHPLLAEAHADLRRIVALVEEYTGLTSRWNGSLRIRGLDFGFSGQKHRSCAISIRQDVLTVPAYRWSTMIHEALHSVSGDFSSSRSDPSSYQWEEAIAEQTQRLLRPTILEILKVDVSLGDLSARDGSHLYNQQIRRLETIRDLLGRDSLPFYLPLLAASTRERARMLVDAMRGPQNGGGIE
jgi:hypothetical protein